MSSSVMVIGRCLDAAVAAEGAVVEVELRVEVVRQPGDGLAPLREVVELVDGGR